MEQKNYTEVFIDGTVFTLGGTEDEAYLRQVAAYLNEKIGEVRKLDGFSRQSRGALGFAQRQSSTGRDGYRSFPAAGTVCLPHH